MDTFCGCDTETLDDLAERVREGALRLIQLIELLREVRALLGDRRAS